MLTMIVAYANRATPTEWVKVQKKIKKLVLLAENRLREAGGQG